MTKYNTHLLIIIYAQGKNGAASGEGEADEASD